MQKNYKKNCLQKETIESLNKTQDSSNVDPFPLKGNHQDIEALASKKILEFEPCVTMIPGSSMRHVEILFWDYGYCAGTLKEAKNWVKNMIFHHYFHESLEFHEFKEAYPDIELSEYKAAYVAHVLQYLERAWENPAVPDDD